MGYIRQTYLADVLTEAGLTVVEIDDPVTGLPWQDHAAKSERERNYEPVGLMNHHTASVGNYPNTPWYPVGKLRLKCNLNIKPDGVVYVISAGYQYDSGYGDRRVLAAVSANIEAPTPTDTYSNGTPGGTNPGVLMNPWFIDIECDHPGDGRAITDTQYASLVRANAAILRYNGWGIHRLKGHLELTRRKIDPYWNYDRAAMRQIRRDTLDLLEADMTTPIPDPQFIPDWAIPYWEPYGDRFWHGNPPPPSASVTHYELANVIAKLGEGSKGDKGDTGIVEIFVDGRQVT